MSRRLVEICTVVCRGARLGIGELRLGEITQRWIADENMQMQQDEKESQ